MITLKKFNLGQTYSRSDENPVKTFDLDLELKFDNLKEASAFHQKLVTLINEENINA